ncbi:MAG: hypothetical protein IPM37_02970 [Hahellaceae bacterium]|nr:hypothetical protein [Hahellaceae bacterium]
MVGSISLISAVGSAQAAYNAPTMPDLVSGGFVNGPLTTGQYEFDNETVGINSAIGDTWSFSLASNSAVELSVSPSEFNFMGAKIMGTNLNGSFGVTPIAMGEIVSLGVLLANTVYSINFNGVVTGSIGGGYDGALKVAAVPVPAAVWLFGSALLGLTLFSRRRNQLANYA